tara:strand:- start:1339 stop:2025 length:687 start_codon:yes stop_codon:yes gene_type:complete
MLLASFAVFAVLLIYLPSFWVRRVMHFYSKDDCDIRGTGAELAQHLIDRFQLDGIAVEECPPLGDHFDPRGQAVRLSPQNYRGKSLTAVAVAAHEVGHAIQFFRKERIFQLRSKYLPVASALNRCGILIMWLIPIAGIFLRAPGAMAIMIALSLLFQLGGAMAHLIILPEEWDASFSKALPILIEGEYIKHADIPAVRRILKAAALTYFSAALVNVLNISRWLILFRR